jgi:hypothetical protein
MSAYLIFIAYPGEIVLNAKAGTSLSPVVIQSIAAKDIFLISSS